MSLTLREKQSLYHSLAALVRSGIPFPSALDKIVHSTRGRARRLVEAARQSLAQGRTVGEAFAAQSDIVTTLEIAVIAAVEKSGQLERGLGDLSEYFGALDVARRNIIKHCAYPIFLLHFGILVLNVPTLILKSPQQFGHDVGMAFLVVYGTAILVALATPLLRNLGADNAAVDRSLIVIPVLGNIRRAFALSRFCTVYGLQLEAGINVIDSVLSAGRSSLSGLVRTAVNSAVPLIRTGAAVGPLLAASDAFPTDLTQSLIVGEETGSLDDELRRMSREYREKAITSLEIFADWLPKVIYVGTVVYLAWKIVGLIMMYIAPMYRIPLD